MLEGISFIESEEFIKCLQEIPQSNLEVEKAVAALSDVFPLKNIVDVYGYVKQMQAKTDLSKYNIKKNIMK